MTGYIRTGFALIAMLLLISCGCTRKTSNISLEYYSGIFRIDEQGEPYFTDCAVRIRMGLAEEGQYETLRKEYGLEEVSDGEPVVITFYGKIIKQQPLLTDTLYTSVPERYPLIDIEIRIDSLLSLTKTPNCASDYIVPGLYRKVHHGQAEILRLKPDYTYSIENFASGDSSSPIQQGRWYRTSELTLELQQHPDGKITPFQIIPVQESLSATGGGQAAVYRKEWL